LLTFTRKRLFELDLENEIHAHLELAEKDAMTRGFPPEEARREARRRFGGIEQMKEEHRDQRGIRWLETLFRDVLYALRRLRKSPGFTAVAILTLALGIGASTAIFSVVDAVLLSPLPYRNPQQLVRVWEANSKYNRNGFSDLDFDDFRAQNHTLATLAEYDYRPASIIGGSEPVRIDIAEVSRDFFKALGVGPFRGREFAPDELQLHGAPAVIVSYGYWQRYLGGAADFTRFHLSFERGVYQVVGVMPPGFDFPAGVVAWIPHELYPENLSRTVHHWSGLGRIRDGATLAQARSDLDLIARRIHARYGEKADTTDVTVLSLANAMVGQVRTTLLTLFAAVILLFLVACINVAGLLLAQTAARRKELAVRAALGASRERLVLQLLAESLALALVGGILGIMIAAGIIQLLPAIVPADLPRQQSIAINVYVLLFTLVATLMVAVGLGLFAAVHAGGAELREALSASSRSHSGGSTRLRSALVIAEIAVTFILLVGAGLLGRSFLNLISVNPGFSEQNLVVGQFSMRDPQNQEDLTRQREFLDEMLARVQQIPGIRSVSLTAGLPVVADEGGFPAGRFIILTGQSAPANSVAWDSIAQDPRRRGEALYGDVSAGYFQTLGIPLIRGRLFNARDGLDTANVAVVSQTLARQRWPNQDPIGRVIDYGNLDGNMKPITIVGIVGDIRARGLDQPPSPIVYVDYRQRDLFYETGPTIMLRTSLPESAIIPSVREIFRELNPNVPVQLSTFAEALGGWMAERRFLLLLADVFGAAALLLTALGIYGLLAHSVTLRTREIGTRMALGAQRSDVLRLIIGEGAGMTALGVAIGIGASLAITHVISTLLFGISATNPLTFAGVALLLSLVALVASYVPARRAMRVDPMTALHYE
jgi:predicted permease